jgi:hypothetical protein
VKAFFGNSTPMMGSSTQSLDIPLTVINGNIGREREKPTHNKDTKNAKLE